MNRSGFHLLSLVLAIAALGIAGCSTSRPLPGKTASPTAVQTDDKTRSHVPKPAAKSPAAPESTISARERFVLESERNRASCYRLQPGTTTTKVIREHVPATKKPASAHLAKKGATKRTDRPATTVTRVVKTTGRCQPQSLIYARCRTGIATCKLGDTSPVQWFACAKNKKATTSEPVAGSVMVLDRNARRGMPTGHPVYVEEVLPQGMNTWKLRISHTNYDRKCHLDQDAAVLFNSTQMTASFLSGPWAPWARELKVLGFILR